MGWKKYVIGDFLTRIKNHVKLIPNNTYSLITIKLYHQGVVKRCDVNGNDSKLSKLYTVKAGQFILSGIDARNAAFGIVPRELENGLISNDFWTHDINTDIIDIDFFYWYTSTQKFNQICIQASEGTTNRKRLQASKFYNFEIWLPTLKEQKKIANRIQTLNVAISNLNKAIGNQSNYLTLLRQTILQEAVQGKLVPQDPKDEPASELLKYIQEHKQQLNKKSADKFESITDVPYEIPKGWVWCRLGEIIHSMDSGWSPQCHEYAADESHWGVLKTTAVQNLQFLENENKQLPDNLSPKANYEVNAGDVLITRAGPTNRVGICCLVEHVRNRLMISDKIIRFHPFDKFVSSKYLALCLNAGYSKEYIEDKKSGMAASQVNISQNNLKETPIAICPLNEQKRIVAKVEKLMQLCDALEQQINQSKADAEQLLQAVLREAFEGKTANKNIQLPLLIPANKKAFAKQVLAGKIISLFNTEQHFTHIKFQKLQFLAEHLAEADLNLNYYFQAAGPYDPKFMHTIYNSLKKSQWFEEKNYKCIALSKAHDIETYYSAYFAPVENKLADLFRLLKNASAEQCEIIATLYAVWNNRIIKKQVISVDLLVADFYSWSTRKSQYSETQIRSAYNWMNEHNIIPTGFGYEIKRAKR